MILPTLHLLSINRVSTKGFPTQTENSDPPIDASKQACNSSHGGLHKRIPYQNRKFRPPIDASKQAYNLNPGGASTKAAPERSVSERRRRGPVRKTDLGHPEVSFDRQAQDCLTEAVQNKSGAAERSVSERRRRGPVPQN